MRCDMFCLAAGISTATTVDVVKCLRLNTSAKALGHIAAIFIESRESCAQTEPASLPKPPHKFSFYHLIAPDTRFVSAEGTFEHPHLPYTLSPAGWPSSRASPPSSQLLVDIPQLSPSIRTGNATDLQQLHSVPMPPQPQFSSKDTSSPPSRHISQIHMAMLADTLSHSRRPRAVLISAASDL